jgi:hypothetical protein
MSGGVSPFASAFAIAIEAIMGAPMTSLRIDVKTYASIAEELSRDGADRAAILASHGLDEDDWTTIEAHWQERLSTSMDGELETQGVPELLSQYSAAFAKAQQAQGQGEVISLERFAEATRVIAHMRDAQQALAQIGMPLSQFLAANQKWCIKMAMDPELAEKFRKILAGET